MSGKLFYHNVPISWAVVSIMQDSVNHVTSQTSLTMSKNVFYTSEGNK